MCLQNHMNFGSATLYLYIMEARRCEAIIKYNAITGIFQVFYWTG